MRDFTETKTAELKASAIKNAVLTEKKINVSPELGKYQTAILTVFLHDGTVAFELPCSNDQTAADFIGHFNHFAEKAAQN